MAIAKEIEGYPEYYASSAGNVWSKKNNETFLKLRACKRNNGYLKVTLYKEGKTYYKSVHRLVAQVFVPIPSKYADIPIDELDIHHVDFNHSNNRASNLMWLTKTEHQQLHNESEVTFKRRSKAKKGKHHSEEHNQKMSEAMKGKHHSEETKQKISETHQGEKNPMYGKPKPEGSGKPPKSVIQYTKEGEFVAEYASTHEAARQTGVHNVHISKVCKGKLKTAGGYKWAYLD